MIEVVDCSILDVDSKYIAHQANCVTSVAAHLAEKLFSKFPYADIYSSRKSTNHIDTPGTIIVKGDGVENRFVINMLGQYYPGKSKFPNSNLDGVAARKRYFFSCLTCISKIEDLNSIAFPYMIGCGAAGGDWEWYNSMLEKFAKHVEDRAKVLLCRFESPEAKNSVSHHALKIPG